MMSKKGDIILEIYGRAIFDTEEKAKELFKIISSYKEFTPERWGPWYESFKKKRIFSPENLDEPSKFFKEPYMRFSDEDPTVNNWGRIVLERKKKTPKLYYFLGWDKRIPFRGGDYYIDKAYLKDKNSLKKWIEYSHKLFVAHEGWFGYIACDYEKNYKTQIFWNDKDNPYADPEIKGGLKWVGVLEKGIPGIFWGNYFNSFYVNWFGKDKFDNLPCVEKEELPDGSIFFTTAETPFDWNTEQCKNLQKKIIEYLGKDAFFDMEKLRKEIKEEVIKKNIKGVKYFDKIDELVDSLYNQLRVPKFPFKIESIKPINRKPDSNNKETTNNKETNKESFEKHMKKEAEIYVNIMKKMNDVELKYTEEDLDTIEKIIDEQIEIGHPEDYEGTIRVLGSYLGETLIRNLGGKWIENDPAFNTPVVEINSFRFFPHAKVYKRFLNGKSDSLTTFYKVVKATIKKE